MSAEEKEGGMTMTDAAKHIIAITRHCRRYVPTLVSLEEVEGVLWAADVLSRSIPLAESALLEARVADLCTPATSDRAREIITRLRAKTERSEP